MRRRKSAVSAVSAERSLYEWESLTAVHPAVYQRFPAVPAVTSLYKGRWHIDTSEKVNGFTGFTGKNTLRVRKPYGSTSSGLSAVSSGFQR